MVVRVTATERTVHAYALLFVLNSVQRYVPVPAIHIHITNSHGQLQPSPITAFQAAFLNYLDSISNTFLMTGFTTTKFRLDAQSRLSYISRRAIDKVFSRFKQYYG